MGTQPTPLVWDKGEQWPLLERCRCVLEGPILAATGFPRGSPQADYGRPGHLA